MPRQAPLELSRTGERKLGKTEERKCYTYFVLKMHKVVI